MPVWKQVLPRKSASSAPEYVSSPSFDILFCLVAKMKMGKSNSLGGLCVWLLQGMGMGMGMARRDAGELLGLKGVDAMIG